MSDSYRPYKYPHHRGSTKSLGPKFESNQKELNNLIENLNRLNDMLAGNNPIQSISKSDFEKEFAETIKK